MDGNTDGVPIGCACIGWWLLAIDDRYPLIAMLIVLRTNAKRFDEAGKGLDKAIADFNAARAKFNQSADKFCTPTPPSGRAATND